jgi:Tfp pilus assembly protein FimV
MAIYPHSRYSFVEGRVDADGRSFLTDRVPFRYRAFSDNRRHIVSQGDTLWSLAGRYFAPLERPSGLWWAIADFQPQPIHDPTIQLIAGATLVIPSVRTVTEEILGERRRAEL